MPNHDLIASLVSMTLLDLMRVEIFECATKVGIEKLVSIYICHSMLFRHFHRQDIYKVTLDKASLMQQLTTTLIDVDIRGWQRGNHQSEMKPTYWSQVWVYIHSVPCGPYGALNHIVLQSNSRKCFQRNCQAASHSISPVQQKARDLEERNRMMQECLGI